MIDKTKQEDLRTALSFSALTFNDELANEHLVSFITDYANRQVLSALEKVKSNLVQLKELKENRDDEGILWGSYDVVDLDDIKSAIEEIEKEYK